MKKLFIPLVFAALAVGCSGEPVAPDQEVDPLFQATHDEIATVVDLVDDPLYVECANGGMGEVVLFTGQFTETVHITTSNSGNTLVRWRLSYDPAFQGVGSESGDVWMIELPASNTTGHQNFHGDGLSWQNTLNEFYTNQDGDRLHLMATFHRTVDANGNRKVNRFDGWCPGN